MTDALRRIDALESAYETVTVGQICSLRARTHGPVTAINIFERGESATYSEMDRLSNRYGNALRAFGVRKGTRVAIMLPNRIEFPILWFALAKLGAILVPINIRYTPREIEFVLNDNQTSVAVVDESTWQLFSMMDPWPPGLAKERVILVGQRSATGTAQLDQLLKGAEESPVHEDVRPDDLLNIQYTSGTTGFPKGCMLTHDYWGVASYQQAYRDVQPYETYLAWSPFFYAYGLGLFLKSYRQGGTLYVARQLSSARCIGWIEKYRIEYATLPEQVAKAADSELPCLKQVAQYDPWSPETVRQFRARCGARALNSYGSTEFGYALLPPDLEEMDDSGSVGIRAPFRDIRLVTEDGSPARAGEVGELWVRGRGIFTGYWNNPEGNAASFDGEWFKTGDLLRSDELGFHWFVGRKKEIIRRSGENIAAREIEAVVREIPAVADVAAVPVRDTKRGEEVKICVELRRGHTADDLLVAHILDHARSRLAVFKVPRYVAFTPALPRTTSSNKVIKRELMDVSDPLADAYDAVEKRWR